MRIRDWSSDVCSSDLSQRLWIGQITADMRKVRSMDRAGVQVDTVLRAADDLAQEQTRQPRRQRPLVAARKAAIEITPVRQVAGLMQKRQRIDHRHCQ